MEKLSENWLTEHLLDFEYKKYILLAYIQKVEEHFHENKLYPDFADLIAHYKNLLSIKQNTSALENQFRKKLTGLDFENLKLLYETPVSDESLNELKQILEFSEPLLAKEIHKGKSLFDHAEKHINVSHVGILPIYRSEGYFMLQPYLSREINVYNYTITRVQLLNQDVYGLNSTFFATYSTSLSNNADHIKQAIIISNPELPNPAVYLFKAKTMLPDQETFLPIAKRLLYKQVLKPE